MADVKNVVAIAGPAGSGKDSLIRGIVQKFENAVFAVNATTRAPRPGERDGVNYHFLTNEQFLREVANGNIPEHYVRADTNTYYGTYRKDLDQKLADGKIVFSQIQIVGARYLKEQYGAATFFIMPPSPEAFERRIRSRSVMSDVEWNERAEFTKREISEEAPWYDYRIANEDGKLDEAVASVIEILIKEGYNLK